MRLKSPVVMIACALTSLTAHAGDCKLHQLPDGTWTAECPSEAPNPPPATLPTQLRCETPAGVCAISARQVRGISVGADCACRDQSGKVTNGQVAVAPQFTR